MNWYVIINPFPARSKEFIYVRYDSTTSIKCRLTRDPKRATKYETEALAQKLRMEAVRLCRNSDGFRDMGHVWRTVPEDVQIVSEDAIIGLEIDKA